MPFEILAKVAALFLLVGAILLAVHTNIIRDKTKDKVENPPYSLARFQLYWWTVIIALCYVYSYTYICNSPGLPALNNTCLILLGIGLGTTLSGRIIDNIQIGETNFNRHQDREAKNFLFDLVADENGVSVHRFQALLFNLIFGIFFVIMFLNNQKFPEFESEQLTLMGISESGYIMLKYNENHTQGFKASNE